MRHNHKGLKRKLHIVAMTVFCNTLILCTEKTSEILRK